MGKTMFFFFLIESRGGRNSYVERTDWLGEKDNMRLDLKSLKHR